jgi:hypothetical protein
MLCLCLLMCVQSCQGFVTAVASGCGPVVSPMFGKRLESPPVSSSRGLRILGPMWALVLSSVSILVSLRLCFKTRELHYLCISFVTQEFM